MKTLRLFLMESSGFLRISGNVLSSEVNLHEAVDLVSSLRPDKVELVLPYLPGPVCSKFIRQLRKDHLLFKLQMSAGAISDNQVITAYTRSYKGPTAAVVNYLGSSRPSQIHHPAAKAVNFLSSNGFDAKKLWKFVKYIGDIRGLMLLLLNFRARGKAFSQQIFPSMAVLIIKTFLMGEDSKPFDARSPMQMCPLFGELDDAYFKLPHSFIPLATLDDSLAGVSRELRELLDTFNLHAFLGDVRGDSLAASAFAKWVETDQLSRLPVLEQTTRRATAMAIMTVIAVSIIVMEWAIKEYHSDFYDSDMLSWMSDINPKLDFKQIYDRRSTGNKV